MPAGDTRVHWGIWEEYSTPSTLVLSEVSEGYLVHSRALEGHGRHIESSGRLLDARDHWRALQDFQSALEHTKAHLAAFQELLECTGGPWRFEGTRGSL